MLDRGFNPTPFHWEEVNEGIFKGEEKPTVMYVYSYFFHYMYYEILLVLFPLLPRERLRSVAKHIHVLNCDYGICNKKEFRRK